jgi:hypothetical protein
VPESLTYLLTGILELYVKVKPPLSAISFSSFSALPDSEVILTFLSGMGFCAETQTYEPKIKEMKSA